MPQINAARIIRLCFFSAVLFFGVQAMPRISYGFDLLFPKSELACIKTFVPKAPTESVASIYTVSCANLFKSKPYRQQRITFKDNVTLIYPYDMSRKEIQESLEGGKYSKYRSSFNNGNYTRLTEEEDYYSQRLEDWKAARDKAKCILNGDELRNVKTDRAAQILLGRGLCKK